MGGRFPPPKKIVMGEKTARPWSFGLVGGKSGAHSLLLFFVVLVISILVHIGGAVSSSLQDKKERPVLALKGFLRDLREFVRTEKRMPNDFRELEIKIWNKGNADIPTRLNYGNQFVVAENYKYIYFSGSIEGVGVANVWAIPLGKYRDEYETVLLVISAAGEDIWRGPALNEQQLSAVLKNKFNPSFSQMAFLNMSKDAPKLVIPKSKKSGPF